MWDWLCRFPTMELNCVWIELWTEPLNAVSDLQLVFHLFRETWRSESILPDSIMCRKLIAGNHRYIYIFVLILLAPIFLTSFKKIISNFIVFFFLKFIYIDNNLVLSIHPNCEKKNSFIKHYQFVNDGNIKLVMFILKDKSTIWAGYIVHLLNLFCLFVCLLLTKLTVILYWTLCWIL